MLMFPFTYKAIFSSLPQTASRWACTWSCLKRPCSWLQQTCFCSCQAGLTGTSWFCQAAYHHERWLEPTSLQTGNVASLYHTKCPVKIKKTKAVTFKIRTFCNWKKSAAFSVVKTTIAILVIAFQWKSLKCIIRLVTLLWILYVNSLWTVNISYLVPNSCLFFCMVYCY